MKVIFKEISKILVTLIVIDVIIISLATIGGTLSTPMINGVIYGFIVTLLNSVMLGFSVVNVVELDPESGRMRMMANYGIRMLLYAILLAYPFTKDNINEWIVLFSSLSPRITYAVLGIVSLFKIRKGCD